MADVMISFSEINFNDWLDFLYAKAVGLLNFNVGERESQIYNRNKIASYNWF